MSPAETESEMERVDKEIKPHISDQDFEDLVAIELYRERVLSLLGIYGVSRYVEKLRKLGIKVPIERRPKRRRPEVIVIVAALLKDMGKLKAREVAEGLGFELTVDSYGNESYSKTGQRYVEDGRKLLRKWRREGVTFKLEGGVPQMYVGKMPIEENWVWKRSELFRKTCILIGRVYCGALYRARRSVGERR